MAAVRHVEFQKFSYFVTWLSLSSKYVEVYQISSKSDHAFGLQTGHNCYIFKASLLGNSCCHGNRIMADMSRNRDGATTQVSSKLVHWQVSYSISNIFQYGGPPPSWIKFLLFWTTHEVDYAVWLSCENLVLFRYLPSDKSRFYNFASLAEKCLTTPPVLIFFLGGGESHNRGLSSTPQKAHPGWRRVI